MIPFYTDAKRKHSQEIYDQLTKALPPKSKDTGKFLKTLDASHRILFTCKTVFPFDLFPDEVIIDENKVDIVYGLFIMARQVFSIPLKNINGATSTTNIFFGSLDIEIMGFNRNPDPVNHLWSKDAVKARRIINGLVIAYKEGVDLVNLPLNKARDQVEQIGKAIERY